MENLVKRLATTRVSDRLCDFKSLFASEPFSHNGYSNRGCKSSFWGVKMVVIANHPNLTDDQVDMENLVKRLATTRVSDRLCDFKSLFASVTLFGCSNRGCKSSFWGVKMVNPVLATHVYVSEVTTPTLLTDDQVDMEKFSQKARYNSCVG
ncbi:uncharacterized protein EV154DRAFT_478041 [Mucor mucedo]|uniref:uncharacterized protein n=1 Tax=Mucor mucedo TaxID=29922 RepID=UPI002220ED5D|nr:uncharacterized protein EV154DRAFT_478041 [Mucor mucedo]KAI7894939.1 hypothetical protein EV154DRAFT_478041 [Mucor mucedo]